MTNKPPKVPPAMSSAPMRQHARLAMGLPVNQPVSSKMPKTPA